jgi:hypothetical protein
VIKRITGLAVKNTKADATTHVKLLAWQVNFMFLIYILGKILHQSIAARQHLRSFTFLQKLAPTSIRSPPGVIVLKSSNQTIATNEQGSLCIREDITEKQYCSIH